VRPEADTRELSFTPEGQTELLLATIVGLVAGVLATLVPMPRWGRVVALAFAPVVALVIASAARPDPSCHYDCPGSAAWAIIVAVGLVAWYAGQALGLACRWAVGRRAGAGAQALRQPR
jgi:hypothetical protein